MSVVSADGEHSSWSEDGNHFEDVMRRYPDSAGCRTRKSGANTCPLAGKVEGGAWIGAAIIEAHPVAAPRGRPAANVLPSRLAEVSVRADMTRYDVMLLDAMAPMRLRRLRAKAGRDERGRQCDIFRRLHAASFCG